MDFSYSGGGSTGGYGGQNPPIFECLFSGTGKKFENRGGAGREPEKNSEIGVGRGGNRKKIRKSGWAG